MPLFTNGIDFNKKVNRENAVENEFLLDSQLLVSVNLRNCVSGESFTDHGEYNSNINSY